VAAAYLDATHHEIFEIAKERLGATQRRNAAAPFSCSVIRQTKLHNVPWVNSGALCIGGVPILEQGR